MRPRAAFTLRAEAQQAASGLPALLVTAERIARTVAPGVHGRRRAGMGEAFWQYRSYTPGDPISRIDWRQTAKSDHVYLRELEWEAAQSLWFWRDASPSMDWRSHRDLPTKLARANLLTLSLALLLLRGGERVGLLGERAVGSLQGAGEIAERLVETGGKETSQGLPGEACAALARHATVVLVSDWLQPLNAIEGLLRRALERNLSGIVVTVVDPAEERLPYNGRLRFEGTEGEDSWLLGRAEGVRADYRRRFEAHHAAIAAAARHHGWMVLRNRTDRPVETALLALHRILTQRQSLTPSGATAR